MKSHGRFTDRGELSNNDSSCSFVYVRAYRRIERYKDFLITGSAVPKFATEFDWDSQGTILRPGRLGLIVEIKRIKGAIFTSKEEAEQDGRSVHVRPGTLHLLLVARGSGLRAA